MIQRDIWALIWTLEEALVMSNIAASLGSEMAATECRQNLFTESAPKQVQDSTESTKYPHERALGALHAYGGTDDRDIALSSELTLPMADRLATHLLLERPLHPFLENEEEDSWLWLWFDSKELKEDMLLNLSKPEQSSEWGGGGTLSQLESSARRRIW